MEVLSLRELPDSSVKRFEIVYRVGSFENPRKVQFGAQGAHTYLDGASKATRENYRKRHYAQEKKFIDGLIPSAALFSFFLIWGESRVMTKNVKTLQRLFLERTH
jgi:hypothetical protein